MRSLATSLVVLAVATPLQAAPAPAAVATPLASVRVSAEARPSVLEVRRIGTIGSSPRARYLRGKAARGTVRAVGGSFVR